MTDLFTPLQAGAWALPNRIVMAPLTRTRAGVEHVPNALMAEYYAQRADAGLLIAEATMVAPDASAFTAEPGIFDADRATAWRQVTDAVHARGGRIVLQIWHPGRAAHSLLNGGVQPISSTDRAIGNGHIHTPQGKQPYEAPRRLREDELPGIVGRFRAASEFALQAGFDGVQIHGAHGYLVDQFLRDGANDRNDGYGGTLEKRARLLLEVTDQAIAVWGADRVSVRISPLVGVNDMSDRDPEALVIYVAQQMASRKLAMLEMRHADQALPEERALAEIARAHFPGVILSNGGYDRDSANAAIAAGRVDAVAFGRAYIGNPDLVARLAAGAPLNEMNPRTLYSPGPEGYTDYPSLAAATA